MKCSVLLLAVTALAGCTTPAGDSYGPLTFCGEAALGQLRLAPAPIDAPALQALADSSPNFPAGKMAYPIEHWLTAPEGDYILCRGDESSCSGEWWQFQRGTGILTISKQDAWVCVTRVVPNGSSKPKPLRSSA